jgi:predicted DNA-binding transcriptional regulator AlpA
MTEELLKQILDELRKPTIPPGWQWWTAKEIASALGYTEAVARDRVVHLPGFPKPYRVGGKGMPRWKAQEVVKWMEQQRAA